MSTESIDLMDVQAIVNPFPGLRPFEFSESHLYFGRDGQSEQLLRKLSQTRFVTVVGTSGSGKSSLVRAGLLPALYGGLMTSAGSDWRMAVMRPGNDPIGNLARALTSQDVFGTEVAAGKLPEATITEVTLRRGSLGLVEIVRQSRMPQHENLLVVVDQFEELFRFAQVTDDAQYQNDAAAFVKLLLEAGQQRDFPIYIVLTLRSDFLGDCSLFWDLPEAINEGQYLIPRLTREQRREAITGPVAVGGGEISSRLVNTLLNDMGDNPDQLPILQHALMRTWDRWKETRQGGEPVDLEHYLAIGGMAEALSRHADEAYNELPDERSREIAEKIFRGLTEKGSDNRETRRPIELYELCALAAASEAEVISVIEVFRHEGRSFLMPPANVPLHANSLVDISHESLIRNWQRLKDWVDDEARSARIYRRLAETAVLYERKEAGLWRDPDLQLALLWREGSQPNKAWARRYHPEFDAAMSFLDRSVAARDAEILENERKRKREIRRTRLTAFIFGLAFLLSLGALAFANIQRVRANNATIEAKNALSALAVQTQEAVQQRNLAELQSDAAVKNATAARLAEHEALEQKGKAEEQKKKAEEQKLLADEATAQAKRDAAYAKKKGSEAAEATEAANLVTDKFRRQLYASNISLANEAYENGTLDRAEALLNDPPAKTGADDLRGFEWHYLSGLFHRKLNEPFMAIPRPVRNPAMQPSEEMTTAVALSSDGIIATAKGTMIRLWDAKTQKLVAELANFEREGEDSGPAEASDKALALFSPTNPKLLVTATNAGFELWDTGSQKRLAKLDNVLDMESTAIAFSPDGKIIATGSKQNYQLWDTDSHKLIAKLPPDPENASDASYTGATSMAFSPDGKFFVYRSGVDKVEYLSVASRKRLDETKKDDGTQIGFLADGYFYSVSSDYQTINFSPLAASAEGKGASGWEHSFEMPEGTAASVVATGYPIVAFSPDGKSFATGNRNSMVYYGSVMLWDTKSFELLATFDGVGVDGEVKALAFSPDSQTLLIAGREGVQLSDASVKRNFESFTVGHNVQIDGVALSPGGERLATIESAMIKTTVGTETGEEFSTAVKLWDTDSHALLKTLEMGQGGAVETLRDGRMVAAVYNVKDTSVSIWDITRNERTATFKMPTLDDAGEERANFNGAAFSPDGKTLAIGSSGGFLQWWDITGEPKLLSKPSADSVKSYGRLSFSPDGKFLAVISGMMQLSTIQIIDVASRRVLVEIPAQGQSGFLTMAFSADSNVLAIGNSNSRIDMWDIRSLRDIKASDDPPYWDADSDAYKKLRTTLEGHATEVNALAFSSDGKTLASGSADKTIKLWNMSNYQLMLTLKSTHPIYALAFSRDNQLLTAGVSDYNWAKPIFGDGFVEMWYAPKNAENKTGGSPGASPDSKLLAAIESFRWRDFESQNRLR